MLFPVLRFDELILDVVIHFILVFPIVTITCLVVWVSASVLRALFRPGALQQGTWGSQTLLVWTWTLAMLALFISTAEIYDSDLSTQHSWWSPLWLCSLFLDSVLWMVLSVRFNEVQELWWSAVISFFILPTIPQPPLSYIDSKLSRESHSTCPRNSSLCSIETLFFSTNKLRVKIELCCSLCYSFACKSTTEATLELTYYPQHIC